MPEKPVFEMTRKQLYDEIWEISVAGMAKKYNIPYSQLMKQVKEAAIPIPPCGYWTKLNFGKPVTKLDLTDPADAVVSIFKEAPSVRIKKIKDKPKPKKAAKAGSKPPENKQDHTSPDKPEPKETIAPPIIIAAPAPENSSVPVTPTINEPETYTQYGQTYNVYNRETLYKEVWEAPVTEVAKRYKVSDVAIHKVCKALEIPTPPAGYWAKLRAGKPVTVIPLPKSDKAMQKSGIRTGVTYQPEAKKETLEFLGEEDRSIILTVASQILLPNDEERMHSKIIAHRKAVVDWKKQQKNTDNRGWNRRNSEPAPFLADTVSDEALPRACHIIDALIKATEPLDCSLTNSLDFVVNGEIVQIYFSESKDEVKHIPTKEENMQLLKYEEERKRYSWATKPQIRKYDHVFNGKLSLTVNGQRNFRDCKSYILEERLGDIMIELYEAAEAIKMARIAREEAERKAREAREEAERRRQEEERRKEERRKRYNAEVDRTLALTNLAKDYDTACNIRRYIAVVEASGPPSSETTEWIEWAKAKADWYDPMVAKEDDFFGKRKHEKDAKSKKLKHDGY
ncbi:hypothetical protein SAMN02745823_03168 [Sporobacter termitidis DSM 10068]|uniref:Uncharacterized protein n=1 Tax=Sporobacter termitidis DSM 10068 TaxID=1123282 RepID=A0A1M5Z3W4_9FIRM|nr:hypothetical protein [Sporobacter termitidis]SHI18808.1 hypothetical protein SAMN02745823_03168 [Sporobacter termitidis DSM 10068]